MQTEERWGGGGHVNSFHLSHPHKESPCPPPPKKRKISFPSPPHVYHTTSSPCTSPPLPSTHLHPPFLLQRMRGIRCILSLHLLAVVFLPPPNASNVPHLLCSVPPSQSEAVQPPTCHGILTPPRPGGPLGPGGPGGPGFPGVPGSPSLPRGPGPPWNRLSIVKLIKSAIEFSERARICPEVRS